MAPLTWAMLEESTYQDNGGVPVLISVYLTTRWYTGQKILKIKNHNDDITFAFSSDKGVARLGPKDEWEHPFVSGATARRTLDSLDICEMWQGDRQLKKKDVRLIIHRQPVGEDRSVYDRVDNFLEAWLG